MNQNAETARKGMKKKFVDELAKTVIETAKVGKWDMTVVELSEESSVDDIAKMALDAARRQLSGSCDNVPEWFNYCLTATRIVTGEDEMQGLECMAALYMATDKATSEQKLTAIGKLLELLEPPVIVPTLGMFWGTGKAPTDLAGAF